MACYKKIMIFVGIFRGEGSYNLIYKAYFDNKGALLTQYI